MLGIYGAQVDVLASLTQLTPTRSYLETFTGLLHLDLGKSVDGLPVAGELVNGILYSLPRVLFAFICSIMAAFLAASLAGRIYKGVFPVLSYVLFLPSYAVSFLVFTLLLKSNIGFYFGPMTLWLACAVAISLPPSALVASQAFVITNKNLSSQHSVNLLSLGVPKARVRNLLYRNLVYEITPTLEKIMTGIITGLMFAEMVFGLPGIGALAIRAIRRSDVDLLLGVVVAFSLLICLARLVSTGILSFYRVNQ